MEILKKAIEAVKKNEKNFFKFLRPNEVGATGSHQSGILISKASHQIMFDGPSPKIKTERTVNITWPNGRISDCHFKYYDSKNEFRITNFGKNFDYLTPKSLGALFILSMLDYDNYEGYFLFEEDLINQFLHEFGLSRNDDNGLIKKSTQTSFDLRESLPPTMNIRNEKTEILKEDKEITANFKSRARLLPQLGDMLIKSEDVAFLELLKNSYDADATKVTVLMDQLDSKDNSIIIIEDNGHGMDSETITDVWLELGSDYKVNKAKQLKLKITDEKQRMPIGEKGIGRLGVHKLGNEIELISKKINKNEVHVKINWGDFDESENDIDEEGNRIKKYIEDIEISVIEKSTPRHFIKEEAHGTFISISSLKSNWNRAKIRDVQRTITSLSSPFQNINEEFKVDFKVMDKPAWLDNIITWENIKDLALYQFDATIEGSEITKFNYNFIPFTVFEKVEKRNRKYTNDVDDEDFNKNDELILSHHTLKRRNDKNEKETFSVSKDSVGKIRVKGYVFDLESYVLNEVLDKKGLKEYLKSNSGVKVFRDDMRVYNYGEPDNDWLELNLSRVNSPGEKISNNIIVCGVFLDRKESTGLKEKTNREGFIENQHFFDFKNAVTHTIELFEILRKSDKKLLRDKYGPTKKSEPVLSSIAKLQSLVVKKVKDPIVADEINNHLFEIESNYKLMHDRLLKTSSAGLGLGIVLHEIEKVIQELYEIVRNDSSMLKNVNSLVTRLSKLVNGYSEMFRKTGTKIVSLYDVIEDSLFSVEFRLRKHETKIIKAYETKGEITLNIAKGLIEGIIINLIDNSLYWLDVALEEHKTINEKFIFIDIIDNENTVEIIIADNGTGFLIPTDVAIEPMETGKKAGLGLGLNIAHEIMLTQKGNLTFPDFDDYGIPNEYRKGALVSLVFKK
ncbi:ATP-binding protein [Flavobacterium yafengii]|uniref:ATP-binding protein n=1 Tax=Flavobacterium yafengii TaxID=3041253 RepID=UPI0024A7BFFD|nr:ATP-binding protein [Flavobacterium yafengii]MDI5889318.1 ATP-binding protein [Flavobacterium yafengii]